VEEREVASLTLSESQGGPVLWSVVELVGGDVLRKGGVGLVKSTVEEVFLDQHR